MAHINAIDFLDCFDRAQTLSTTPGHNGWTLKQVAASGSPTAVCVTGKGMALTIAATSEVESLTMYQNDVLPYSFAELQSIEFLAKVAGVDAVTQIVMGVGSTQNATPDSVAYNAWFKVAGADSLTNVVCETDDNVTDTDDKATGATLSTTFKKFNIDFTQGLGNIRFFIDGNRVASGQTFSMAGAATTQGIQPFFQIQKGSGTGVPSVTIGRVRIRAALSY